MAEKDKRYYWLKLKRDFFKRHDIRIIEAMPNGKDYILFYLKLLCESVDHEGQLRFSDQIPYNEDMLATITDTNVDVVRSAIKIFTELEMMELLDDGTIYMREVEKMMGSESYWAERKRIQRNGDGQLLDSNMTLSNDVGQIPTCPSKSKRKNLKIELEKEKEIEKETEKEKRENTHYQQIADMYNETCVSFPRLTTLSDARKKAIKARLNTYTVEDFQRLFEKAEASSFLKGANDRNWSATFDWLIKDTNMAKVLDGNYDNRTGSGSGSRPTNRVAQQLDESYDMMRAWAEGGRVNAKNENV